MKPLNHGAAGHNKRHRHSSSRQCVSTFSIPAKCSAAGIPDVKSCGDISRNCADKARQESSPPTSWRAAASVATALSLMVAAPQDGSLEAQAASLDGPSTSYASEPIESQSSFNGFPVLPSPPLMLVQVPTQSTPANLWVQLGAIIAANVVVVQGVAKLFSKLRDRSSPVTLVKLQLGLVTDQTSIRSRLAELSSMIKVGGKGVWIILEEALLEFAKYQNSCKLADVAAVHMASKSEAYDLFEEVAKSEVQRAQQGEADAHLEGEGDCAVDWEGTGSSRRSKLMQWLRGPEESNCDDALVVTLVVAARGDLEVPNTVSSWSDLAGVMKTLGGLSSEQLMALDLTWSPSKDNEFLTKEQLVQDYTNLKPVK